jgi:hypothetical protein
MAKRCQHHAAFKRSWSTPIAEFNSSAGESLVMIPLLLDRARPVKANISLDAGLLEAIDAEAAKPRPDSLGVPGERGP